jgi:uncharacterized iron-regulated protein
MLTALLAAQLFGCAHPAAPDPLTGSRLDALLPTALLLLGEQHDAPEHQALQRETVRHLAARGLLAAVVLEMAEQGRQTGGLPADSDEARVRQALDWSGDSPGGWAWSAYGPVVMAAVRAGVPVLGGNLPRGQMRSAMGNTTLDSLLPDQALQEQRDNIREGHCGLLPETQVTPMTRIQLARDQSMARTAVEALRPGQTVLLVAGNQHVRRDLGVPRHLPEGLPYRVVVAQSGPADEPALSSADRVWNTPPRPPRDYCAEMKQQMGR